MTIATLATAIPLAALAVAGSNGIRGLLPVTVLSLLFLAPAARILSRSAILGLALGDAIGDHQGPVTLAARGAPLVLLAAAAGSVAIAVAGVVAAVRSRRQGG